MAYGTINIAEAIERAQRAAARGECAIVVGITRFAAAHHGCWHVCLSWQGGPVSWVSAHRLKQSAEEQIERVCQAVQQGRLANDTQFAVLQQQLAAYGEPGLQETLEFAPELLLHSETVWDTPAPWKHSQEEARGEAEAGGPPPGQPSSSPT